MTKPNVSVRVGGHEASPSCQYKTVVLKNGVPFASQVTEPNSRYVIRWNFDLGGRRVNLPENCILQFEGGSLNNGVLGISYAMVYPSYNDLIMSSIVVDGIAGAGTMWYDGNKPLWSNGVTWVDAVYNKGVLGYMKMVQLTEDMWVDEHPESGTQTDVVYVNNTDLPKVVGIDNVHYRTPTGDSISITVPAGGYGEVNLLNISGIIYARAL